MLLSSREYKRSIEITKEECYKMRRILFYMNTDALDGGDIDEFSKHLNTLSLGITVLGFFLPGGKVASVAGLVGSTATLVSTVTGDLSFKKSVESAINMGNRSLQNLEFWFDDNPKVQKIRTKASFLELTFTNEAISILEHTSPDYITAQLRNGIWYEKY